MADRNYTLVPFRAAEGLTLKQAVTRSARRGRPAAAPDASASCFANRLGRARHAPPRRHAAG
jgi:hypothetical protein